MSDPATDTVALTDTQLSVITRLQQTAAAHAATAQAAQSALAESQAALSGAVALVMEATGNAERTVSHLDVANRALVLAPVAE